MKKLILFAAAIMMTGCGFMQNSSSSNTASTQTAQTTPVRNSSSTAAMSAGQGAGSALQSIYTQYKADGKFDYKNMQNILNTVTLVANCEGLKDNIKNTTYIKDFGKGLIASSLGLVTQDNVTTVTNSLVNMVTNTETVQQATSTAQSGLNTAANYANTAATYASSIGSLLSLFGGQ